THDCGHVQPGLLAGAARFAPAAGAADDVFLWGANLSTMFDVGRKDHAIVQVTYGPGVGRYRGGITAAPDSNGSLDAVEIFGLMGAYQHAWNDEWRSTATYAWARSNLPGGVPATTTASVSYLAVNLIWQFCDKAW